MESYCICGVLEQYPGSWVTQDNGGSGSSSFWVLLMTSRENRGTAPDQAFPSVSNGFNLEDLTASVNWYVW